MILEVSDETAKILVKACEMYRQKLIDDIKHIDATIECLRQSAASPIPEYHIPTPHRPKRKIVINGLLDKMISAVREMENAGAEAITSGDIAAVVLGNEPNPDNRPMWSRVHDISDRVKNLAVSSPDVFMVNKSNPRRFLYSLVNVDAKVSGR